MGWTIVVIPQQSRLMAGEAVRQDSRQGRHVVSQIAPFSARHSAAPEREKAISDVLVGPGQSLVAITIE